MGSSPAGDYRKVPRSGLILLKALGVATDYGRVVTRRETSQAIDSVSRFLFLVLRQAQEPPFDRLRNLPSTTLRDRPSTGSGTGGSGLTLA